MWTEFNQRVFSIAAIFPNYYFLLSKAKNVLEFVFVVNVLSGCYWFFRSLSTLTDFHCSHLNFIFKEAVNSIFKEAVSTSLRQTLPFTAEIGWSISAKYLCRVLFWVPKVLACEVKPERSRRYTPVFHSPGCPKYCRPFSCRGMLVSMRCSRGFGEKKNIRTLPVWQEWRSSWGVCLLYWL